MGEQTFDANGVSGSVMDRVVEFDELVAGCRLMRLGVVARLDESKDFEYDGYTSTSAFLIHRCGMSAGQAGREVFLARSLDHMAYAVKAAYAGNISLTQLELLAHARQGHPEIFAEDEETLVDSVSGLTVTETRQATEYWCQAHDGPGEESEGDEAEPSRAYLSKTWKGRWQLNGHLDPVAGDLLNTALDELMSEIVDTSPKEELEPAPVRRAEALEELARRFLDSPDAPTDHGNRPHITAVVDWEVLTGKTRSGLSELLDGTVISPESIQRIACDARVCRLLTGPRGEILDLGRTVRTVTPAQWRALRLRDRHCQSWGCRRPAAWCDAHHLQPWTHDGPTDINNLVLICRHHHTLIHRQGWKLTGTPGHLTVTRPDGTNLPNAPP